MKDCCSKHCSTGFLSLYPIIKYQLVEEYALPPQKGTNGSSGWDVFTHRDLVIPARGDIVVCTGIRFELPHGFDMTVVEKSGVATKKKLDIGACLVDSDYRGLVHIHLFNNSNEDAHFEKGNKIAQLVIRPVWMGQLMQTGEISTTTTRGEGGFGSTDKK